MKKWIGILLIAIMFSSSIAFAIIQAFSIGPSSQQTTQVQLPTQQIIDYELSPAQMSQAMSNGLTVATYTYDRSCVTCAGERATIESVALSKDFQNQILVQEIAGSGASRLDVVSYLDSQTVNSIDTNSTVDAFCKVVINQPVACAIRQHVAQ